MTILHERALDSSVPFRFWFKVRGLTSLLPVGTYKPNRFMAPQHVNPEDVGRALFLREEFLPGATSSCDPARSGQAQANAQHPLTE
jgi:hypothetical protein